MTCDALRMLGFLTPLETNHSPAYRCGVNSGYFKYSMQLLFHGMEKELQRQWWAQVVPNANQMPPNASLKPPSVMRVTNMPFLSIWSICGKFNARYPIFAFKLQNLETENMHCFGIFHTQRQWGRGCNVPLEDLWLTIGLVCIKGPILYIKRSRGEGRR